MCSRGLLLEDGSEFCGVGDEVSIQRDVGFEGGVGVELDVEVV